MNASTDGVRFLIWFHT